MDSKKSDEQIEIDRIAESKEREVSQTLPKKETIPKKEIIPKKDKPSLIDQIKQLTNQKINSGFELKDKKSAIELRKVIMDELKINPNSRTMVRDTLKEVFIENKLQISDLGFKNDKIGDMTVNLISEITNSSEKQITVSSNIQSPHGALPKNYTSSSHGSLPKVTGTDNSQTRTEQSEEPEKKFMSESAQKKLISHGLTKLILPLYKAIGICELDESEEKEESKVPKGKQMEKDFEELAGDLDEYLTENNIKLPALLNHLSIVISIFVVMVMPVIKFKMFSGSKEVKPNYDIDAESVKVD